MNSGHWAGSITAEQIAQQGISNWAKEWRNRALQAERDGVQLIVMEVPTGGLLLNHAPVEADQMLMSTELYRELYGK